MATDDDDDDDDDDDWCVVIRESTPGYGVASGEIHETSSMLKRLQTAISPAVSLQFRTRVARYDHFEQEPGMAEYVLNDLTAPKSMLVQDVLEFRLRDVRQ